MCHLHYDTSFFWLLWWRFPVDPYDRFWEKFGNYSYPWVNLTSKNKQIPPPGYDYCSVPSAILQKASTIEKNFSWLNISIKANSNLDSKSMQLLPVFHFAELGANGARRTFDIFNSDDLLYPNLTPTNPMTTFNNSFLRNGSQTYFVLRKASGSELPPLINAFELYSRVWMIAFTTASSDGKMKGSATYTCNTCLWSVDDHCASQLEHSCIIAIYNHTMPNKWANTGNYW